MVEVWGGRLITVALGSSVIVEAIYSCAFVVSILTSTNADLCTSGNLNPKKPFFLEQQRMQ